MGMKSNYFRHSFDTHSDGKIRKLIKKCGAKGYAIYFVLLEFYCTRLMNEDGENLHQEIDLKLVGSYLGLRSDSVHSCIIVMGELGLIEALSLKYDETMIKLSIPKSLKYYGKYKNVSEENCPNKRKEKERKEKKRKEKEVGEPGVDFEVDEIGVEGGGSPGSDASSFNPSFDVTEEARKKFSAEFSEGLDALEIKLSKTPEPMPVEETIPPKVSRIKGLRKPDFRFVLGEPL